MACKKIDPIVSTFLDLEALEKNEELKRHKPNHISRAYSSESNPKYTSSVVVFE